MSVSLMPSTQGMGGTAMLRDHRFSFFPHIPPPRAIPLQTLPPQACAYLPGRETTLRAFAALEVHPTFYHALMDAGFRRSGQMFYQPVCVGCRACEQIRVPIATFAPTRSQRRSVTRNVDVVVDIGVPEMSEERFNLYARYCAGWHNRAEPETAESLERFLYTSPVETIEFTYRVDGRLIGVGICDVSEGQSLSSVYFYFDPDEAARSLGTFSAMCEIDYAKQRGIPHHYLGYFVRGCDTMEYKVNFGPAEVLGMDGAWRGLDASKQG